VVDTESLRFIPAKRLPITDAPAWHAHLLTCSQSVVSQSNTLAGIRSKWKVDCRKETTSSEAFSTRDCILALVKIVVAPTFGMVESRAWIPHYISSFGEYYLDVKQLQRMSAVKILTTSGVRRQFNGFPNPQAYCAPKLRNPPTDSGTQYYALARR
jgi:hypothetical protein